MITYVYLDIVPFFQEKWPPCGQDWASRQSHRLYRYETVVWRLLYLLKHFRGWFVKKTPKSYNFCSCLCLKYELEGNLPLDCKHQESILGDFMFVWYRIYICNFSSKTKRLSYSSDRLRDTLIHEMCHAAAWLISGVKAGHGTVWKKWWDSLYLVGIFPRQSSDETLWLNLEPSSCYDGVKKRLAKKCLVLNHLQDT